MKSPRKPSRRAPSHFAWRPSQETRELFDEFHEQYPYINKTPFLDVALSFYLECILEHGFDMKTLRPYMPIIPKSAHRRK